MLLFPIDAQRIPDVGDILIEGDSPDCFGWDKGQLGLTIRDRLIETGDYQEMRLRNEDLFLTWQDIKPGGRMFLIMMPPLALLLSILPTRPSVLSEC